MDSKPLGQQFDKGFWIGEILDSGFWKGEKFWSCSSNIGIGIEGKQVSFPFIPPDSWENLRICGRGRAVQLKTRYFLPPGWSDCPD